MSRGRIKSNVSEKLKSNYDWKTQSTQRSPLRSPSIGALPGLGARLWSVSKVSGREARLCSLLESQCL